MSDQEQVVEQEDDFEWPTPEELLGSEEETSEEAAQESGSDEEGLSNYVEDYDPDSPTDAQKEAISRGWNPEGVEGKRALTSEEFLDRQPLYDDIRALKRGLKDRDKTLDNMKKYMDALRKKVVESKSTELLEKRDEAIELGDKEAVRKYDQQIASLKDDSEFKEVESQTTDNAVQQEIIEATEVWGRQNEWYSKDRAMTAVANEEMRWLVQNDPDASIQEKLQKVTEAVKQAFPNKFQNPARSKPSAVESAGRGKRPTSKPKLSWEGIDEESAAIGRQLIRSKVVTEEEWLESMKS